MSDVERGAPQAVPPATPSPGIPVGPGPLPGDDAEALLATVEGRGLAAEGGLGVEAGQAGEGGQGEVPTAGSLSEVELEALLFVAERPLSRRELASLAGVDRATVDARLGDLEVTLAERGIRLVVDGDRIVLATAPEAGALIARYIGADAIRLTQASLETLAIVAYRQPVTKAAVERIRGVDSDYTIKTLLHRRLIVELGRSEAPGRPYLYGTSIDFLERFGLTSLEGLPPLDVDVAARLAEEGADAAPALAEATAMGEAAAPGGSAAADRQPPADELPLRDPG